MDSRPTTTPTRPASRLPALLDGFGGALARTLASPPVAVSAWLALTLLGVAAGATVAAAVAGLLAPYSTVVAGGVALAGVVCAAALAPTLAAVVVGRAYGPVDRPT